MPEQYIISAPLLDDICDALTRLPYREVQGVIIRLSEEIADNEQQEQQPEPDTAPQLIVRK
jgi:hypothetical protein